MSRRSRSRRSSRRRRSKSRRRKLTSTAMSAIHRSDLSARSIRFLFFAPICGPAAGTICRPAPPICSRPATFAAACPTRRLAATTLSTARGRHRPPPREV